MNFLATPTTSHLALDPEYYGSVYEPAEDSFLLLDALERDVSELRALMPSVCVEIGCGSGIVSTFLGRMLDPPAFVIGTDINAAAARATRATMRANGPYGHGDSVRTCFVDAIQHRLKSKIDVLLFNPPYVETPEDELGSVNLQAAWAGGRNGRSVIDDLLPIVPQMLSPRGRFYLLLLEVNQPEQLIEYMQATFGFHGRVVIRRRCGMERLCVVCFRRNG